MTKITDEVRDRRKERRPRYLKYAIEHKIPWRWLNKPYAIRFGPDNNRVDFYTTHAMVSFNDRSGKEIWLRGFDALKATLIRKGLIPRKRRK